MTKKRFCTGVTRRDFIQVGAGGIFGMGLTLPQVLQAQARSAASGQTTRDVSLIFLFLHGGLSTIDTWDMKPNAPGEFRGEFSPIQTNVTGIQVCEHLPRSARHMDKFSLVRSFRHHNSDHGAADHYMFTGFFSVAGFIPTLSTINQRPSLGSVIARKLGPLPTDPPTLHITHLQPTDDIP